MKTIPLKVNVPLTFEEINFLESDLSLIPILAKLAHGDLPQTQLDRIERIRKLLISIKEDKNNKWWKHEFSGLK
jgi:hypothetical protein